MSEVGVFVALPEGLDTVPPGPELHALLDTVDRSVLNGYQLVRLMRARHRQLCWEQAQLLADLHELAYAHTSGPQTAPTRSRVQDTHAAEEVSFALSWTMTRAEDQLALAYCAIHSHPALYAALSDGQIDLPKLRVIVDEVDLCNQDQAAAVIAEVLAEAHYRTTGQLRRQIRRLVLTIDPDLVHRRYRKAIADRNVSAVMHKDGTATITGRFLPPDKAAAAMDFLSAAAKATKKAGDPNRGFDQRDRRSLAQLRADIFCDLLAGADPTKPAAQGGAGAIEPAPRRGVVNLGVELATLMGLANHPGDLAGFGPVVADIAREMAQVMDRVPVWRFHVMQDGRVIHEGRLHRRPTADQIAYVRARDRTCQTPTCLRPAHQCEIDHNHAWEHGGITDEDNLAAVCGRHHRAKSEGGFRLYRTDFGLMWISPRGHAYPVTYGRELDADQRRILQELVDRSEEIRLST